jgi:hypothetical protein
VLITAALAALAVAQAPAIDPSDYSHRITNPWYPLKPGTVLRYRGRNGGERTLGVVQVTRRTRMVAGVRTTVVHDRLFEAGRLAEDTYDWYAQHRDGTVWYFGEATREVGRDGRTTSRAGSWEAGVDGARPGIVMPGRPRVGAEYEQEHFPGHAEDRFRIERLRATVRTPFGSFRQRAMRTRDWNPLERGVLGRKFYVRGIGEVKELNTKGPRETKSLVSVAHR